MAEQANPTNAASKKIRQLSEDEKIHIKEAFDLLDTDKDGFIDYYEMKAATRALGLEAKKAQILSIMRTYDPPHGNKIGYEDFYYIISDKMAKRNPLDELKYAFTLFTADTNSNKISLKNLQEVNQRTGSGLTDDEMQSMIEEFDTDLDGLIDEAEFMEIMTKSENWA
ncbi:centrin-3-like [Neodiprion virginianus]|uniref:centrin-3-like n=1 Tax=Neodiprion virginianus TaxID=2961670 RepID=UPI001EE76068|nr:centrin-3-like [Neodiprion virginianus]